MSTPHTGGADPPLDPRAAFAELSKIMLNEQQLSETLGRVAELAKQTITGAADVSVTLMDDGHVSSVAFTGPLSAQLDERQYEAGFGPCMDAALSGATVTIEDTAADATYPDFGRAAARQGITHTMSIGLPVARQTIGALNIYGTAAGSFDAGTQELATAFASYAAVAVANAGVYASTRRGGTGGPAPALPRRGGGPRANAGRHPRPRHSGGQPAARPAVTGRHRPGEGRPDGSASDHRRRRLRHAVRAVPRHQPQAA